MLLEGSCQCGAVRFSLRSAHPYPFNLCYCSICRKTAGGGGYAINLSGESDTLDVKGREHITVYHARLRDPVTGEVKESTGERSFCSVCGSMLWVWAPEWPELIHPFASAIDTPLPVPPERTHLMLASKAPWVTVRPDPRDKFFDGYPDESIAAWHQRLGLEDSDD
ncbi:MAG: GFA family protein [Gammaproteobacteria bacterium]|nr:GFA family protein [Gammaproteobacteria bacterium]